MCLAIFLLLCLIAATSHCLKIMVRKSCSLSRGGMIESLNSLKHAMARFFLPDEFSECVHWMNLFKSLSFSFLVCDGGFLPARSCTLNVLLGLNFFFLKISSSFDSILLAADKAASNLLFSFRSRTPLRCSPYLVLRY